MVLSQWCHHVHFHSQTGKVLFPLKLASFSAEEKVVYQSREPTV
jgi:hypothetical protein